MAVTINRIYPLCSHINGFDSLAKQILLCKSKLSLMVQVQSERRELKSLDERQLLDIGIDRLHANRESNRAFYDLPDTRVSRNPGYRSDKNTATAMVA